MSASGHERTFRNAIGTSALLPKADVQWFSELRFVRYSYKSPHIHAKMAITMTVPIMIPDIFSFVTCLAFAF